jgi:hypothetical protein
MLTRRYLRSIICGPPYLDGFFSGTASTDGSSDQLIDIGVDGIKDIAYDSDRFENSYLYIPKQFKSDGLTIRNEEEQRVLSYEPANGLITIGRNFATPIEGNIIIDGITQLGTGTYYEIHSHGLSPRSVNSAIDWSCNNARQDMWFMLGGQLFDGDMQYEDAAYWSTGGPYMSAFKEIYSNESIAKRVLTTYGRLFVDGTTQTIATTPGRTLKIYAAVRSLVRNTSYQSSNTYLSAGIQCTWFNPNNVYIDSLYNYGDVIDIQWSGNTPQEGVSNIYFATGLSEELWGGQITVPDDCYSMTIRLIGSGNWSAVAIYDTQAQEIPWPGFLSPADQYAIAFGYYPYYGRDATTAGVVGINAPPRPDAGSWSIVPAQYPGPLAVRAAAPFPRSSMDGDAYPSNAENYLVSGAYRFLSTQLARPDTMDNTRFEMLRLKAERDWQAHSMSRNPLARSRPVYGRSRQ